MKILNSLGLFFYQTIDKNGFLFLALKPLNIFVRYLFYTLLIVGSFIVSNFLISLIDNESYEKVLSIFNIMIAIYLSLIVFYESLYSSDVKSIVEAKKEAKKLIKANRSQWWRLRNMNVFIRIVLYIFLYIAIQQILILNAFIFMQTVQLTANETNLILNDFKQMMHYFTISYIIVFVTIDYFASKKRNERKQNFSLSSAKTKQLPAVQTICEPRRSKEEIDDGKWFFRFIVTIIGCFLLFQVFFYFKDEVSNFYKDYEVVILWISCIVYSLYIYGYFITTKKGETTNEN